jgi:hypothetical protein
VPERVFVQALVTNPVYRACPACPVAPVDGTGVGPADPTGSKSGENNIFWLKITGFFCHPPPFFAISASFCHSPLFFVIPAKAGIQEIQLVIDSRLFGNDVQKDFLRVHQVLSSFAIIDLILLWPYNMAH